MLSRQTVPLPFIPRNPALVHTLVHPRHQCNTTTYCKPESVCGLCAASPVLPELLPQAASHRACSSARSAFLLHNALSRGISNASTTLRSQLLLARICTGKLHLQWRLPARVVLHVQYVTTY